MAGISSITGTSINSEFKYSCTNNQTGVSYTGVATSADIRKQISHSTASANNISGGGDEVFSFQQAVSANSTVTVNLNGMTNVLNQTAVAIARIKGYQIRLLSAADDSTLNPAPTATSVCVVTNNPPSSVAMATPNALDFGLANNNGGSGLTLALTTGATIITSVAIGAAGSGYPKSTTFLVAPNQAGGSGGCIAVTTNSSGVPTTVALVAGAGGTGYSNATVPSTPIGGYTILTGGFHCYSDVGSTGFVLVDATHNNIAIVNLDASNAITVEIDVLGATS